MKLGIVYAGQGSQKVGMGASFYEHDEYKSYFDVDYLDFDLKTLCFEGPLETLSQTKYTQPCMVALAVCVTDALKANGIQADMVAGLSLGEYSALYAAGVFDKETVMKLVYTRGKAMTDAVQGLETKMVAVMGLDRETLQPIVDEITKEHFVATSNFNCPGQIVCSGSVEGIEILKEKVVAAGAKRAIELNTSGPFHTKLLEPASLVLKETFETTTFNEMQVPVVFNCLGKEKDETTTIASLLEKQVMSPVYFEDSIKYMIEQGVDTFIEVGPGKVLSGFIKKVDRKMTVYQVEDYDSLMDVVSKIKGE